MAIGIENIHDSRYGLKDVKILAAQQILTVR